MCLAIPGKILEINGQLATVDFSGMEREVNVSLVDGVVAGDYVIVHAGFAIEKVSEDNAKEVEGYLS